MSLKESTIDYLPQRQTRLTEVLPSLYVSWLQKARNVYICTTQSGSIDLYMYLYFQVKRSILFHIIKLYILYYMISQKIVW